MGEEVGGWGAADEACACVCVLRGEGQAGGHGMPADGLLVWHRAVAQQPNLPLSPAGKGERGAHAGIVVQPFHYGNPILAEQHLHLRMCVDGEGRSTVQKLSTSS
jgi:hypothetical protein